MKNKKIYFSIISLLFLLITSKQSILYPINDWCDSNVFFTVGKSWMNGIVPYKVLFEQKGPILFLIYGLGYLISNKTFIGCFIIEIFFFTLTIYYSYKIINKYFCSNKSYYILMLYIFLMVISQAFYGGGSAEEYCMFFITYNMYLFIKYIKKEEIKIPQFFLNGLFCSIVFLIKFNLTSFWIGYFIIIIIDCIKNKKYKPLVFFCIGFLIPLFLAIIYFYCNTALYEFIDVYFIKNIFEYSNSSSSININNGITNLFVNNIMYDPILIFLLIFYLIYIFMFIKNKKEKKYFLLIFIFPFLAIASFEVWFEYYFLPFCIFILMSIIWLFSLINFSIKINKYLYITTIFILTLLFGKNTYMIKYNKEDFIQYKFANIINKYEDKTILNYGFIDTGFYLATNTMPNVRFFHTMNFDNYEEMNNEQLEYIKTKKTNFIITKSTNIENIYIQNNEFVILKNNYQLISIGRHNVDYGLYYALYKSK